jgi:glycosyltransferase involved in cell wall biosynthesis
LGGLEIVVGNDGADPRASEIAAEFGAQEVAISPIGGAYNARNRALKCARGEWVAFTDAGVVVDSGWIETGIAGLKKADYACGPVIISEQTVHGIPHLYDWLNSFPVERYFRNSHFGPTANLFVRREMIERLGAFDARLRSGGDVEFGNRVHAAGFVQRYSRHQTVYHPPRTYREQLLKELRVTRGVCELHFYYPERFPQFRVSMRKVLRNLMPPRRLVFRSHSIDEFGPIPLQVRGLLYLIAWSMKLQRVRGQLKYLKL